MKAVVMCGGIGSRMRPITETIPKPLLPLGVKTVLDVILETLKNNDVQTVYLTLGYKGESIEKHIINRSYPFEIIPVYEEKALGTAGGVKNAVGDTDDDILVVSGDNIFNFDLQKVYREHKSKNASVTIVGTVCSDPRDYGTMVISPDQRIIKFVEKPNWAHAESDIINTGIYFISGEVLREIPVSQFFDFASDVFPKLLTKQKLMQCSLPDGKWWDLGDIPSYLSAFAELMKNNMLTKDEELSVLQDRMLANGTKINAPCIIGKNVLIGANCKIGPNCFIGDFSVIENNCHISNSLLGENAKICQCNRIDSAYIGNHCTMGAFCIAEKNTVISEHVKIGSNVQIAENTKIWHGSIIPDDASLLGDVFSCTVSPNEITASGVTGTAFTGFSLQCAIDLSCAVGSLSDVKRIGISVDGTSVADIYCNAVRSGLLACGATVYDFGQIFRVQRSFLSFYCSLDFFIHVSSEHDLIHFSFCEKNGQPLNAKTFRLLSSLYRYRNYKYADAVHCVRYFEMHPMLTVYKAYLSHLLEKPSENYRVAVDCDNREVYEILTGVLKKNGFDIGYGGLLFIIDRNAERFYAIENERAFSFDRIITICCRMEFATGADVSVGEEASGQIEELAEKYGRHIYRAYEDDEEMGMEASLLFAKNLWVSDALFCIVRLLNIMKQTKKTLAELSDEMPDYYVRHLQLPYNGEPIKLKKRLLELGAVRSKKRLGYFEIEDERGVVRLKPDATGRNLKVLVEANNIELSRELTSEISSTFEN